MNKNKVTGQGPCPHCTSSDAYTIYSNDSAYCFSCGTYDKSSEYKPNVHTHSNVKEPRALTKTFNNGIPERGISREAVAKYGVTVSNDTNDPALHVYPYYSTDGSVHIANKLRMKQPEKSFVTEGQINQSALFGQQLFPVGCAKAITVVEGELDALAAYDMHGRKWPCVSVQSASTAKRDCVNNFEYLNSFESIVLVFDKDEPKSDPKNGKVHLPGQEAAQEVAALFPIGKVKVVTLQEGKDACDYLKAGKTQQFLKEWWSAPTWTPSGLKLGKDMWDEIIKQDNHETILYPWESLNEFTYGLRRSELVVVTGDTGIGKTQFLKEAEYHVLKELLKNTVGGIGLLHLEETNRDTCLGLMSIEANKQLHLPDVRSEVQESDLKSFFNSTVNNDRVVIWDHFGSNKVEEVLNKIRHMHNLGCNYIILDHLSIVVSDQSGGDERKQLDEISTKLKTLCMELNVAVIAVIHQNRAGQIRGTAGVEQVANIVIKLYRDKTNDDPWKRNVMKLVIEKNRFCGKTGPSTWLWFVPETGRLVELNGEEIARYEEKVKEVV